MAGDRAGVLANLDQDAVIDRIAAGEYAAHIAPELQVTKQALQYRLRNHPKYQEAREVGCELRLDRVMAKLASIQIPPAPNPADYDEDAYKLAYRAWKMESARIEFDLARAEKEWRTVAWQAEREFPHRWGQKTEAKVDASITVRVERIGKLINDIQDVIIGDAQQQALEHGQAVIEDKSLTNQ